jgi:hypothetical protein
LRLLLGVDDELARMQPPAAKAARVEVEHAAGWKSGSRGKIRDRCCHGFKERSCSQRQILDADASVTPCSMTGGAAQYAKSNPAVAADVCPVGDLAVDDCRLIALDEPYGCRQLAEHVSEGAFPDVRCWRPPGAVGSRRGRVAGFSGGVRWAS